MSGLILYGHPFSSYCWKALIALYENAIPFDFRVIDPDHPDVAAAHRAAWPLGKFPVLDDGGTIVPEATVLIEYLHLRHRGPVPMLPDDRAAALEARLVDRLFDNHVMNPMQVIVGDCIRPPEDRDPTGVKQAHATLDTAYDLLDARLAGRTWGAGEAFGLADCAAAPALFYADWVHPIGEGRPTLAAYRARLLARPSVARAVDEARPYRAFFPPGAPDRD